MNTRLSCYRRPSSGFTLVELLVVIGIIALLIGVLLPALNKARQQSQAVACLSNMRQLGTALQLFAQEHKGYLPKAYFNARPNVTTPTVGRDVQPIDYSASDSWGFRYPMYGWDYVVLTYTARNKAVFQCPTDSEPQYRGTDNDGFANLPDKPDADNIPASYRINNSNLANYAFDAVKISQLRMSSLSIVLLEGAHTPVGDPPTATPYHHVATWESGPNTNNEATVGPKTNKNVAWNRHVGQKANYTFADGHAETLTYAETWVPIGGSINPAVQSYRAQTMWRQRYDPVPGTNTVATDTVQ